MNNVSNMFGICYNWKVLVALVVVGTGLLFVVSPAQAVAAAPLLLFALCPLSMVGMVFAMKKKDSGSEQ